MSLASQDERLARRVGAITLLMMGAVIACFVFLLDRLALGSPARIRVMFRHSAGLHEHAALIVAGQPVGRIEAIVPVPHGAGGVLAGEVGVAVVVAVAERSIWKVPASAEIFVASRGPLADKYLEVAPRRGAPGPAIHDGLELRGVDPPSLDNVLQHTWTNMTTFKLFVEAVRPELEALRARMAELRAQLDQLANDAGAGGGAGALATETRALVEAARQTYEAPLGGEAGLARFRAMVADARQVAGEVRAAVEVLGPRGAAVAADLARVQGRIADGDPVGHVQQVMATVRSALDKVDPLLAKLDELGKRIAAGEGSLGRLIQDPEFPEDAKDLGKIMKRQPWKIISHPKE